MKQTKLEKDNSKKSETQVKQKPHATPNSESPYELLEPLEEKVIRMRYGISESDNKELEYAVGASEESKERLGLMEASNIAALDGEVPVQDGANKEVLCTIVQTVHDED